MYLPFYKRGSENENTAERDNDDIDKELDDNIEEYRKHQLSVTKNKLADQAGHLIRENGDESISGEDIAYPHSGSIAQDNSDYKNPYRYLGYK